MRTSHRTPMLILAAVVLTGVFLAGSVQPATAAPPKPLPPTGNAASSSSQKTSKSTPADPGESPRAHLVPKALREVPTGERMLLLHSGRVISGEIIKSGENYTVRKPTGEMFIPGSQVRMECDSLRDALEKLRDQMPGRDPAGEHIQIARWCLQMQMLSDARLELQETLRIDSTREEARTLLKKLDEVLDPPPATKPKVSTKEASQAILRSHYGANDVELLGGLPRDQARQFTQRIQPILLNNCTLAGCHGSHSTSPFKLEKPPAGSPGMKSIAERNLSTLLKYVDRRQPLSSDLLTTRAGPHAHTEGLRLTGIHGPQQLKELKAWLTAIRTPGTAGQLAGKGRGKQPATPRLSPAATQSSGTVDVIQAAREVPATADDLTSDDIETTSLEAAADETSPNKALTADTATNEADSEVTVRAVSPRSPTEKSLDPFDPQEFNQSPSE